jgi:hypothetical protein
MDLIHFRDVQAHLGLQTRSIVKLCAKFDVPVVRLNNAISA